MGLKYGQGKYGQFKYGPAEAGFQFKVLISNAAGAVQKLVNNEIESLSWGYKRNGGCSTLKLTLKREYNDFSYITTANKKALYDIQVYIQASATASNILFWRGYTKDLRPTLSDAENVVLDFVGYGERLSGILMNDGTGAPKEYSGTTVSALVTSIINDFITPNTPITSGTIDTFSTAVASIKFNGTAMEAIQKLADIVGAEWGVDRNRQIYFRNPSATVGHYFKIGYDIAEMEDEYDYSGIINKVYIEGGDVDGVPFRHSKADAESITNYGLFEALKKDSSIIDATLATAYENSLLAKYRDFQRNIRITLPRNFLLIEADNPIKLAVIVPETKIVTNKYGTFKYGAKKYTSEETHRIERIDYTLNDVSLLTEIEFGLGKPDFLETQFNELKFAVEQQRQAAGV